MFPFPYAYRGHHAAALALIERIREAIENHDVSPDPESVNWGHVGDIASTRKALREISDRLPNREQDAIQLEAARVEAFELDAIAWSAVRADDHALDHWDGAMPIYRPVPRWAVRPDGVERSWHDIEVKVETRDGWPVAIELRAGSRLTRRQAVALAEALLAAAGADAIKCNGFVGANAWGACASCGRRLEDHTA